MKKLSFFAVLLVGCAALAFSQAQAKPVLGILPFTGGTEGDGDTIAFLLSIDPGILNSFIVVARDAALDDLFREYYFQLSGLTDSDTIAGIGHLLNADYVLSGHIRRLGDRNLIIASIVNVESLEQVAGYYRTYGSIEEVPGFLPSMSRNMIAASLGRDTSGLPNLAMLPFIRAPGIDRQDAETLSQILAVEILNTGEFVVLPRTSTIVAAMEEMDFQLRGYTDELGMAAIGRAINADLVLSGGVRRLGTLNMFTAQMLRVADGSVVSGASRNYQVIADGIDLMAELAMILTGGGEATQLAAPRRPPREARPPRSPRPSPLVDPSRFWSLGFSGNVSLAELSGEFGAVAAGFTLKTTLAPWRNSFIRIGCDFIFGSFNEHDVSSTSVYPFVHYAFFRPFAQGWGGGWYIGTGVGLMNTSYRDDFGGSLHSDSFVAMDFTTGFMLGWFSISYTLRTDFSALSDRVAIGFNLRFRSRETR